MKEFTTWYDIICELCLQVATQTTMTFSDFVCSMYIKMNDNIFFQKPQWEEVNAWTKNRLFSYNHEIDKRFHVLAEKSKSLYEKICLKQVYENVRHDINNYLKSYYEFVEILRETGVFKEANNLNINFLEMIIIGYHDESFNSNKVYYRFFSPIFLEKICIIYDYLNSLKLNRNNVNNDFINNVTIDVIKRDILSVFYDNLIIDSKIFVLSHNNIKYPYLVERKNTSSVVKVNPMILLDKIISYINQIDKNLKCKNIYIAIIGYIDINCKEVRNLFDTLYDLFGREYNFYFNILVNKDDYLFNNFECRKNVIDTKYSNIFVNIIKEEYLVIFSPNLAHGIYKIIEENDMIFLLDNPNIYVNKYISKKLCYEHSFNDNYLNRYKHLDFSTILNYKFAPIHFLTRYIGMCEIDSLGYDDMFYYDINRTLISAIKNYMVSFDTNSTKKIFYIFLAQKNVIDLSYFEKINFIEEKDSSEFYCMKIVNYNVSNDKLFTKNQMLKNYIIFSYWDFVKNIGCISEISFLANFNNLNSLMHLYVKMTWKSGFKEFTFEIITDDDILAQFDFSQSLQLLKLLINAAFFEENTSKFKVALNSAIYNNISCLDDVIFYYLFSIMNLKNISPKIDFLLNVETANNQIDCNYCYSSKNSVIDIIRMLNSKIFLTDQYNKIREILKKNQIISEKIFFKAIADICVEYNYTNTHLFYNVKEILG